VPRQHPANDALEAYALDRPAEPEAAPVEKHLLPLWLAGIMELWR
jgi:hypothetical protein